MMIPSSTGWKVLGVFAALLLGLVVIRWLARRFGWSAEHSRKAVHIVMGLTCAAFPWYFDGPAGVWWLALSTTLVMAALRWIPFFRTGLGSVLHGVSRPSYGEILFAPAVAVVFLLANGDPWLHAIPIGILAIADAASALAGTNWGKRHYVCGKGRKTVEGSTVFFIFAFLCAALPLGLSGRTDWTHAIWIGLTLATLTMMAEGLSDRGFDNLVIPIGACFVLSRLLPLESIPLMTRFLVASSLLTLVLTASRWSTLNGDALLGAALLGYGCGVLADVRFVVPLLGLFACHLSATHRHQLRGLIHHRLDSVLSQTIAILPWVVAVQLQAMSPEVGLTGACFAVATQISLLDASTRWWLQLTGFSPMKSLAKGWLIGALPGLMLLHRPELSKLGGALSASLLISVLLLLLFQLIRPRFSDQAPGLWITKGFLSLAASLPALLLS